MLQGVGRGEKERCSSGFPTWLYPFNSSGAASLGVSSFSFKSGPTASLFRAASTGAAPRRKKRALGSDGASAARPSFAPPAHQT